MNKTNKKFKRLLEKLKEQKTIQLRKEYEEFVDANKNDVNIPNIMTINNINENNTLSDEELRNEFKNKKRKEFEELHILICLVNNYEEQLYFDEFSILQNYFELFNFTLEEQADVYAYFIHLDGLYFENFTYENNKERVENYLLEEVAKEKNVVTSKKRKLKKKIKDFIRTQAVFKNIMAKVRGSLISEDGELLPLINADEYRNVLEDLKLNLTDDQISLIVNTSKSRALQIENDKKRTEEINVERELAAKQKRELLASNLEAQKIKRSNEREALHKLKSYIVDGMPLRMLTEEEIQETLLLLNQAGYSREYIIKVQKTIIDNNNRLAEEELKNKIIIAKQRLLSVEEIEIFENTKKLINTPELNNNPILNKIISNYNLIIELLIKAGEAIAANETIINEEIELLIMCISELKDMLIEYSYSDYRLVKIKNEKKDQ